MASFSVQERLVEIKKMVTKRIRSEYMKKFKDPKWETYSKCYEEMLKYRLARRLLEHSHNPWFWGESDTDSDSGGSPTPTDKNQVKNETTKERTECEAARMGRLKEQQSRPTELVPRLVLPAEDNTAHGNISLMDDVGETRLAEEEQDKERASGRESKQSPVPRVKQGQEDPRPQLNKTSKQSHRRAERARPAQIKEDNKQSRHPFALYASGEKDSDISSRKTHNVGPAASTKEIHESALRAKTRREVERQLQSRSAERRRAKSADAEKARFKLVAPEFNPWLTEYMRCFSARSR